MLLNHVEPHHESSTQSHGQLLHSFSEALQRHGSDLSLWDPPSRSLLLQLLLHYVDIANTCKPTRLAVYWAGRILQGESLGQRCDSCLTQQ